MPDMRKVFAEPHCYVMFFFQNIPVTERNNQQSIKFLYFNKNNRNYLMIKYNYKYQIIKLQLACILIVNVLFISGIIIRSFPMKFVNLLTKKMNIK